MCLPPTIVADGCPEDATIEALSVQRHAYAGRAEEHEEPAHRPDACRGRRGAQRPPAAATERAAAGRGRGGSRQASCSRRRSARRWTRATSGDLPLAAAGGAVGDDALPRPTPLRGLAAAGARCPAGVVMEPLGHAQIPLTLNTYSHVMPSLMWDAADAMDRALKASCLATRGHRGRADGSGPFNDSPAKRSTNVWSPAPKIAG